MDELRKCIGSARFGIEAHEAPAADFPVQPSQKDGLGRMCRAHWNQYTTALRKAAEAAKAEAATNEAGVSEPEAVVKKLSPAKGNATRPVVQTGETSIE